MPRGGKRQGTPGQAYSNRTDLMENYSGAASAIPQAEAQAGAAQMMAGMPQVRPGLTPDQTPMPRDPSTRPLETIESSMPNGQPPTNMAPGQGLNPGMEALRAAYQATGNLRILDMIEWHERFGS